MQDVDKTMNDYLRSISESRRRFLLNVIKEEQKKEGATFVGYNFQIAHYFLQSNKTNSQEKKLAWEYLMSLNEQVKGSNCGYHIDIFTY